MDNECGSVYIDIHINRVTQIACYLFLSKLGEDGYEVVGGGRIALELFSMNSTVHLRPIDRQGYTHMVTQRE